MKKLLLAMAGVALTAGASMADTVTFDFVNEDYGMTRFSGSDTEYNADNTIIAQEGCPVTITVNSGTRLWNDGLRMYKQSVVTFEGATITNIDITLKSGSMAERYTVEPEGLDGNVWTGSSDNVIFTCLEDITKGNLAAQAITVTYEGEGGEVKPGKKNPEIAWAEKQVFCSEGSYMMPRLENPYFLPLSFTSSNEHVAAISAEIDEEDGRYVFDLEAVDPQEFSKTTITAIFEGNDEYEAATASFDLYMGKGAFSLQSIGWDYEDGVIDDQTVLFLYNPYTVAYKNGKNNYVASGFNQDSERVLIYGNLDFNVGETFWCGFYNYTVYNGIPEFKTIADEAIGEIYGTKDVVYPEVALADVNKNWLSGVITIKDVDFAEGTPESKKTAYGKNGEAELAFYNNFAADVLEAGTYDVVGAVTLYKDEIQVYPISYTPSVSTGVESVAAAGEAQYFNLQGQRVANPDKGICIRVQNGKAEKIVK